MTNKNINKKWKVASCGQEDCWCRLVITEDCDKEKFDLEDTIICPEEVNKEIAEHIVMIHNLWLKNNKNEKK